jgi:hypothetical protein
MSEFREFPSAPYLTEEEKKLDSSLLDVDEIARVADLLLVSLCNKRRLAIRHMKRPLFPTTLSIPSYDTRK